MKTKFIFEVNAPRELIHRIITMSGISLDHIAIVMSSEPRKLKDITNGISKLDTYWLLKLREIYTYWCIENYFDQQ